jgi:2-amino-4-hydroxy-6-hydroxymethyldihydropteridine diphosphokinase
MPSTDDADPGGSCPKRISQAEPCHIGVGSNLGDREALVRGAVESLRRTPGVELLACSSVIETEPVGPTPQPMYLNAVVMVRTTLNPAALLAMLQALERAAGRRRQDELRWGPRTLDLDLLLFGGRIIRDPGLEVPHPRLHERRFVLEPLVQIDPGVVHPVLSQTARDLLAALNAAGASSNTPI